MAQKRKRAFDGLYAQLEETDGNVVLFSAKGEPSVIFEMTNPVQQLCTDAEQYLRFQDVLSGVVQTLGEGYALQKQDILCKQSYRHEVPENAEFLTKSYFRYFEGREFTEIRTFLIITQEVRRGQFVQYDPKRWLDFHSKVAKVDDILKEKGIKHRKLSKAEVNEYCHRFMAFRFRHGPFSMTNFKASDEYLKTGGRVIRSYPLVDIDEINLPSVIKPYTQMSINGYGIATDLLSFLTQIPFSDCVVFNQVVQIPEQRKLLRKLQAKAKRHGSMPDPSNKIAKADIEEVLNRLAIDSTQLVYCNFNILVSCPADKVTPVTSYLETKLYECGIMPSRTAYNQLELFTDSFPGNAYAFNPDYDLFLTLSDAALCFFFKEHLKGSEETPLTTYYTDRQGLPVCIDITGKEGKVKMTDNANFFCIGPSGSGKSFQTKREITNTRLAYPDDEIIILDPAQEFGPTTVACGGRHVRLSPDSGNFLNPMGIADVTHQSEQLQIASKTEALIALCGASMADGDERQTDAERSIVSRCFKQALAKAQEKGREMLIGDVHEELRHQPDPEARFIALRLERYVDGALSIFNHPSNVEFDNPMMCFSFRDLPDSMRAFGMVAALEFIRNRMYRNFDRGVTTWLYVDEVQGLFGHPATISYLSRLWAEGRKFGLIATGITQNVKDLLSSREVTNIFENSDFIYMLNQAAGDRQILADQLNISPHQLSYVTHSGEGEGLLFYGNVILPFVDRFPTDLELYRIMTTKLTEVQEAKEA